jgi:glycine hydroxymethyltransferase
MTEQDVQVDEEAAESECSPTVISITYVTDLFCYGPVVSISELYELTKRVRLGGLVPARLSSLLRAHEKWRLQSCLNMLPSENFASEAVRSVLSCDLSNRYTSPDHFYMGTKYIDQIQVETENLAKHLFRANFAEVRPLSGHSADMIVLTAFADRGDTIMTVDKSNGGYPGISDIGYPRVYGLRFTEFPFNKHAFNIDVEKAALALERERPKLVVFGASLILFPHPVRQLSETCHRIGATVVYDGSHVLGLIAGGQFQDPLREGADLLIGSTHKSFFGPQGGIILSKGHEEKIRKEVHPAIVDNAHWNRIAALYVALSESRRFGRRYARQVIRNSKSLATALDERGIKLVGKGHGFTESHQTIVDVTPEEGVKMARRLEKANIIVDVGVRIGTSEETRRGMKEEEMECIAELISRVHVEGENPRKVSRDVLKLRREFAGTEYC